MYIFSYEKLEVWQNSRFFILDIYKLTNNYPTNKIYGMTSQLKRSASSIATNIAEGTSRNTNKDKTHFLTMSYSSAIETLSHLIISNDLNFISNHWIFIDQGKVRKNLQSN
jgi:four helix bundle protein